MENYACYTHDFEVKEDDVDETILTAVKFIKFSLLYMGAPFSQEKEEGKRLLKIVSIFISIIDNG